MGEEIKTNREIYMDVLKTAGMEQFVKQITGTGKCLRCSNRYWDGNYAGCRRDCNRSSCEEGIRQYMESYPGENLQVKYHKKYLTFRSYEQAQLGHEFVSVLYKAGVVERLEPPCSICTRSDCPDCDRFWCNILDMSRHYAYELVKGYDDKDDSLEAIKARELYRKYYQQDRTFLSEILVPKIKDDALRKEAESLVRAIMEKEAS